MLKKFAPRRLLAWADSPMTGKSPSHRAVNALGRVSLLTLQGFRRNELALRAAALTFTIMLSLVPILAMSTAAIKGLGGGDELKMIVYSYVATLDRDLPPADADHEMEIPQEADPTDSTLTHHLYAAVDRVFDYVERTNFTTLGTFGTVGLLLSVVLVLGNIEMAMNAIWHVESGRSFLRKISDYLALLILLPISANIGLAASAVLTNEDLLARFTILMPISWVQAVVLQLLPVLFITLSFYVMYLFFPNTRVRSLPALAGALFAAFFWFEAQNLYVSLQLGVAKYNAIYGSFATLPLFLLWVYFGWVFILLGAQIAYAVQNRQTLRLADVTAPPSLQLSAAFDLLDHVHERFAHGKKASLGSFLQGHPHYSQGLTIQVLDMLRDRELVHYTAEHDVLKPSLPRDRIDDRLVVAAVLGTTCTDTEGGRKCSTILAAAAAPLAPKAPQEKA